MINPFDTDGFNQVAMTEAINLLPVTYGRVNQSGLFRETGVTSNNIIVESKEGTLTILPTTVRGARGPGIDVDKRKLRSFILPHINHPGHIDPSEVQDVRAFGEEQALETAESVMNEKLLRMRTNYDITKEWHRCGALAGVMLDADGTTLFNYFTEFGVTQKVVDFVLGTGGTSIQAKCMEVRRHVEQNLRGDTMSGVMVECSQTFFEALIAHAKVVAAWSSWNGQSNALGEDPRAGFPFAGLIFREYVASAPDIGGTTRAFITAGDARAYPTGTNNTFATHFGPGAFMDGVNKFGTEIHVRMEVGEFNRQWKIWSESNVIHMCRQPAVLVRCHSSN